MRMVMPLIPAITTLWLAFFADFGRLSNMTSMNYSYWRRFTYRSIRKRGATV